MSGPTDPTEPHFDKGLWGYDGTQWRRLGVVWGYADRLKLDLSETSTGGGSTTVTSTAVPAGYVYNVQTLFVWHDDPVARYTVFYFKVGAALTRIAFHAALPQYQFLEPLGGLIMKEGDQLQAICVSLANTERVYLTAFGYKMAVAE